MGRELRRVALDFNWPLGKVWPGFVNPHYEKCHPCKVCDETGYSPEAKLLSDQYHYFDPAARYDVIATRCERDGIECFCPACNGTGTAWDDPEHERLADEWNPTDPRPGEGWQLWETVTEGSPISPVFGDAIALANWLAEHRGDEADFGQWLKFLEGPGWAPSFMIDSDGIHSGVSAMVDP